ncbi:ketopantoate reductase family protein [Roseomonas sp. CCTCC AB2023176]|uniref:ketopantoate reductase family protein n=1 Tax=Roseomonas sp. CCTCC AB2023176 TaxID=3342640 RepID=UPI0035D95431
MRICVFGAGAIGGHLAVRLANGGAEVSVVARGAYLDAIRSRGLTINAPDGSWTIHPKASADPGELGPQDAVIVTAKGYHLPGVAAGIGPLLGPETPVAFVMNGIPWWYFDRHGGELDGHPLPNLDPGGAIRRAVGVGRTIGGVVYSACTVTEPGVVFVEHARNRVILGEPDGTVGERVTRLAEALKAGGIGAPVVPDIRREVWLKLVSNLSNGPLSLCTRQDVATTLSDSALLPFYRTALEEAAAIARALGQDTGLDVEERIRVGHGLHHRPSILQDLDAGKQVELEAMAIAPLQLARLVGVETPILDLWVAMGRMAARHAGAYAEPS